MPADETRINLLLDFYGPVLTEKQREAVEMYYSDDMSITEIADELGVSRQAACNTIKRGRQELESLDEKLKLLERFSEAKEVITKISAVSGGDKEIESQLEKLSKLL